MQDKLEQVTLEKNTLQEEHEMNQVIFTQMIFE
jgi:hypothetical protein